MVSVTVARTVDEHPDDVWGRVGDFARPQWLPGVTVLEVVGEGPGAFRVLGVPRDGRIVERLVQTGDRTMTWTTDDGSTLPLRNYRCTLSVAPADPGAEVTWTASFDSAGPPEGPLSDMMRSMLTDMLAAI